RSPKRSGRASNGTATPAPVRQRADARRAIFAWINWDNRTRLHSTLAYRSPLEWKQRYRQQHTHREAQAAQPGIWPAGEASERQSSSVRRSRARTALHKLQGSKMTTTAGSTHQAGIDRAATP